MAAASSSSQAVLTGLKAAGKDFIKKIHPDRFHGHHEARKCNNALTSTINAILFQRDQTESSATAMLKQRLSFFLHCDSNGDLRRAEYQLECRIPPLDLSSVQSFVGLFQLAGIETPRSTLDALVPTATIPDTSSRIRMQMLERLKTEAVSPWTNPHTSRDLSSVRSFLQFRQFIRITETTSDGSLGQLVKALHACIPVISRYEQSTRRPPVLLFDDLLEEPIIDLDNGIMKLPVHTKAAGTFPQEPIRFTNEHCPFRS
jgi:hypothetical protein